MAFAAMILGPLSSEMCISCSRISAGVGMVAMLSEDPGVLLLCAEDDVVSRDSYRREGKRPIWTFEQGPLSFSGGPERVRELKLKETLLKDPPTLASNV